MAPSIDNDRQQAAAFIDQAILMQIGTFAFNQTVNASTPSEILSVLQIGQRPLAVLIMSPVTAKTFALSLLERVKEFEKMSGYSVKTYDDMELAGRNLQE